MIICTLCGENKTEIEFYTNKRSKDGYAHQCKRCVKKRSNSRFHKLMENEDWAEKEKIRSREKYRRLGYNKKQPIWDKDKPWKRTSEYKNLNRNLRLTKNETAHHWNYNYLLDVFILTRKQHKKIHKYLIFDNKTLCFKTIGGLLLKTKESHKKYIDMIIKIEKL